MRRAWLLGLEFAESRQLDLVWNKVLSGRSGLPNYARLQPAPSTARAHSALPQLLQPSQELQQEPRGSSTDQKSGATPERQRWRDSLPTPQQVAERLRSGSGTSCSSVHSPAIGPRSGSGSGPGGAAPPHGQEEPALDWREVVARARAAARAEQPSSSAGRGVLTDTFGRAHTYLRISLTERCNLRCLYCMPEEGVDLTPHSGLLSAEEVERLAALFVCEGVTKIRLTGGEPTLRRDLEGIVRRLASLPGLQQVGITTNGLTLARRLPALQAAGLTLLNISLDTLRPERFESMTRRRGHARVLESIRAAVGLGYDPVKVNVVVMKGVNDDEVRFIEYMPFDGNVWSSDKLVPYRDMMAAVQKRYSIELERCAEPAGEVAKNFRLPGHAGSVSFVTSMTSAFCGDCNRLRLMADGNLKVCLFGANEVSLRDAIKEGASDDDLRAVVAAAVGRKRAAHAGMFELARSKNRAMVKIGG